MRAILSTLFRIIPTAIIQSVRSKVSSLIPIRSSNSPDWVPMGKSDFRPLDYRTGFGSVPLCMSLEMAKFARSVAGHPKLKLEMSMLKTSNKSSKRVVTVIKNEHTKEQMSALDDEWLTNKGPVMTLAETLAYAAKRDKERAANAS